MNIMLFLKQIVNCRHAFEITLISLSCINYKIKVN